MKKDEDVKEESVKEVAIVPVKIDHDYHREDLNDLRDAVNYLLSK